MASWDRIKAAVEKNDGVLTVTMEKLRKVHGAKKLGKQVCSQISKGLSGMGLCHIPDVIPSSQEELVRLYKRGTTIGDFIATALAPGKVNDKKLVARFGDEDVDVDYGAMIESIRELVAE